MVDGLAGPLFPILCNHVVEGFRNLPGCPPVIRGISNEGIAGKQVDFVEGPGGVALDEVEPVDLAVHKSCWCVFAAGREGILDVSDWVASEANGEVFAIL